MPVHERVVYPNYTINCPVFDFEMGRETAQLSFIWVMKETVIFTTTDADLIYGPSQSIEPENYKIRIRLILIHLPMS